MGTVQINYGYGLFRILLTSTIFILSSCSGDSDGANGVKTISFESMPIEIIDHNKLYKYQIITNNSSENTISYNVNIPSWLSFDSETNIISGLADWNNVDVKFNIIIKADNGIDAVTQSFSLSVELGEIICNQDFGDHATSLYALPWNPGESFKLSQSYCPSNPNWGHHNWFAYDFDMPIGTELLASRAGEVIAIRENNPNVNTADCSGGKENFVFILHNDGTVMSYVHLTFNGVEVNVGSQVEQGDIIGYSGNSGCTIGPHTHIALFKDNTNYDRQSTVPFNYNYANGLLDSNNGLVQGEFFTAL